MSHLLSLSELHAAAPGVLDVVFGADGEFLLAPMFRPPLWHADGHWVWQYQVDDLTVQPLALDARVRSAAQRLAALCCRAADPRRDVHTWRRAADLADRAARCEWPAEYAATLARLCVALAPRIRDLSRRES